MNWWALKLVGICIVVFVLQIIFSGFTEAFALVSVDMLARPWTLFTSIFLHADPLHLLYNMFAIAVFGLILEKIIGSRKFLILFFAGGIFASLGSMIFYPASIGASGAIFSILGALAVLRPRMVVYVGYVPMSMIFAAAVWAAFDLLGMFAPSSIANAAHLFGLGLGIAVGLYLRKDFSD